MTARFGSSTTGESCSGRPKVSERLCNKKHPIRSDPTPLQSIGYVNQSSDSSYVTSVFSSVDAPTRTWIVHWRVA